MNPLPDSPSISPRRTRRLGAAFGAGVLALWGFFAGSVEAATVYALVGQNRLTTVDTANVQTVRPFTPIRGLAANDTLVALDVRPQTQGLFALAINPVNNTATLYHLEPRTSVAVAVGSPFQLTDGVNTYTLPNPATNRWDIDFNPAADRLRVVCGGPDGSLNFRINPNSGAPVDGDNTGLTSNNIPGVNPDGAFTVNGQPSGATAAAYTNNSPNVTITSLYSLDEASDSLFLHTSPNTGAQTKIGTVHLANGDPLDLSLACFDILPGVVAPASNQAVSGDNVTGMMVTSVNGIAVVYQLNLTTAEATLVGSTPYGGSFPILSIAARPDQSPAIALTADGTRLLRFDLGAPGAVTSVALPPGAVTADETLVAIDQRPQTGQLYGLGIDPVAETGTLYRIDPQNGACTAIGTPRQISFAGVDFPDPATTGYGFDFNPAADRIRVVTGTGLNFRLDPTTGAATSATPDALQNGLPQGSTGVTAAAYTDSYAQMLPGSATTLYTLDAASDSLLIQNPPNSGTQTAPIAVTSGGTPLDFGATSGFDIANAVLAPASNAPAPGDGFLAATVGSVTSLYRLDLATGQATSLGPIDAGSTPISGLVVNAAPPVLGVEDNSGTALVSGVSMVTIPAAALGSSSAGTFIIRNRGTQALTYTANLNMGTTFAITGNATGTIPAGGSRTVTVTFTPASSFTDDLVLITTNDPQTASFQFGVSSGEAQTDDTIGTGNGPTRFQPLVNDPLRNAQTVIVGVSDSRITIGADGRTLILPSNFSGTFTYSTTDGTSGGIATITASPLPATLAPTAFSGIVTDANGATVGFATATLSAKGTGSVRLGYRSAAGVTSVGGRLAFATGVNTINVAVRSGTFEVDRQPGGDTGAVSVKFTPAGGTDLTALLHAHVKTATPRAQTLDLASTDLATYPGGGYALSSISRRGAIRIKGLLPDGIPFSAGTTLTDVGTFGFYIALRSGVVPPGVLGGEYSANTTATTDFTGELVWSKPSQTRGRGTHLGGVNTTLLSRGSHFDKLQLLPAGNGTLRLIGGNLAADETTTLGLTGGIPALPTGALLTWRGPLRTGTSKTGLFNVTVAVPGLTKPVKGTGVYLQKSGRAWGYFPGTTVGGRIELTVP